MTQRNPRCPGGVTPSHFSRQMLPGTVHDLYWRRPFTNLLGGDLPRSGATQEEKPRCPGGVTLMVTSQEQMLTGPDHSLYWRRPKKPRWRPAQQWCYSRRQTKVETRDSEQEVETRNSEQEVETRYSEFPGGDQPSKVTQCHLFSLARYSRATKDLSGETKMSTLHSFNQLPGGGLHQDELLQPTNDPARCQEALHLPAWWCQCAVFFALLLSFAATLKTGINLHEGPVKYLLLSAVLTLKSVSLKFSKEKEDSPTETHPLQPQDPWRRH